MAEWHVFARVFLESQTQNWAIRPWMVNDTSGSEVYEGLVLAFGNIDRAVGFPAGMPQIGDARVRVADTTRALRNRLAHETPRRRLVELKIAERGGQSLHERDPIYTGEIMDATFGPGYVEFTLRDVTFSWLDEIFPDLITHETFPELSIGVDSAFANIINGQVISHEKNPQGAVPLPHIGFASSHGDWYGIAAHPIYDLVAVYRKLPGEGVFTLVDESEFTIVEEVRDAGGLNLTFSILQFLAEQPPGTLIQADVEGIDARGGWGSIPGVTGLLRNPVDFFINMAYFFLVRAGIDPVEPFDVDDIAFLREQCESLFPDSSTDGTAGLYCDGALVKPFSAREFFGRFLPSFGFTMYQKKNGKITLKLVGDGDSNRVVFARNKMVRNTFIETMAKPTFNQVEYRSHVNYCTNEWAEVHTYDNDDDQRALGNYTGNDDSAGSSRSRKIERDNFDFWFVRDNPTAAYVIAKRMGYLALGSYRQAFKMPLPEVIDDIDLADLIGITHPFGLEEDGGYQNREAIVTQMTLDLDRLSLDVRSILSVPQTIEIPETILRRTAQLTGGPGYADSAGTSGLRFRTTGPYIGPTRWTKRGGIAGAPDDFATDKESGRLAIVNGLTSVFGQDWVLFLGTASSTGDAELWYYKDVTKTWEKLFGDGINGGWGASQYESVTALYPSGDGKLYIGLGSDAADGEVWRYQPRIGKGYIEKIGDASLNGFPSNNQVVLDFAEFDGYVMAAMGQQGVSGAALWGFNGSSWTEFGGPTAIGPDFGSGHFTVNSVTRVLMDDFLYVGLGAGGVFGNAGGQVWRNGGFTWGKVLGNGINGGFNCDDVHFVRDFEGGLIIGVGGNIGDGELWHWDGTTATKIGGDSVQGSWTTKRRCQCVYVDGHDIYVGVGSPTGIDQNNAEVWKYTGPGIHGFWTKLGGQGLDGSWNALEYNTITALTKYGSTLWAYTAGNSGAGEAWRYAL